MQTSALMATIRRCQYLNLEYQKGLVSATADGLNMLDMLRNNYISILVSADVPLHFRNISYFHI